MLVVWGSPVLNPPEAFIKRPVADLGPAERSLNRLHSAVQGAYQSHQLWQVLGLGWRFSVHQLGLTFFG